MNTNKIKSQVIEEVRKREGATFLAPHVIYIIKITIDIVSSILIAERAEKQHEKKSGLFIDTVVYVLDVLICLILSLLLLYLIVDFII